MLVDTWTDKDGIAYELYSIHNTPFLFNMEDGVPKTISQLDWFVVEALVDRVNASFVYYGIEPVVSVDGFLYRIEDGEVYNQDDWMVTDLSEAYSVLTRMLLEIKKPMS